jgi:hypothetical protein
MMAVLSRMFPRRNTLVNVKADPLVRWLRKGFWLLTMKVQNWEAPLAQEPPELIREMAADNPISDEEHIANVETETRDSSIAPIPWGTTCATARCGRPIPSSVS